MKVRNCENCGESQYRKEIFEAFGHETKSGRFIEDKIICKACGIKVTFDKDGNLRDRDVR